MGFHFFFSFAGECDAHNKSSICASYLHSKESNARPEKLCAHAVIVGEPHDLRRTVAQFFYQDCLVSLIPRIKDCKFLPVRSSESVNFLLKKKWIYKKVTSKYYSNNEMKYESAQRKLKIKKCKIFTPFRSTRFNPGGRMLQR